MTIEAYDQERLVRYLLGALPESEAARFDELSVSDRTFADALSAAEHDLVDAYVRGELAGDDLARFESHYLASPLRRDKVSFARALHELAARNAVAGSARGLRGRWMLAAAVLMLAAAAGWLAFENTRLRRQMDHLHAQRAAEDAQQALGDPAPEAEAAQTELARLREERERLDRELQSVTVLSVVLMPQLRSAAAPPGVTIPPGTTHVAFRLPLEPGDHSAVRVTLVDASSRHTLWSGNPVTPRSAPEGTFVDATIRADLLPRGRYLLRASAVGRGAGIVGDYPFAVVPD